MKGKVCREIISHSEAINDKVSLYVKGFANALVPADNEDYIVFDISSVEFTETASICFHSEEIGNKLTIYAYADADENELPKCDFYYSEDNIVYKKAVPNEAISFDEDLYVRGKAYQNTLTNDPSMNYYRFKTDGRVSVSGKLMGLIDFANPESAIINNNAFDGLFADCQIVDASGLILPRDGLMPGCFAAMFRNCSSLVSAPALPATILARGCYEDMFRGCTSLEVAPILPATNLADYCYAGMFRDCASLKSVTLLASIPSSSIDSPFGYNQYGSWLYGVNNNGRIYISRSVDPDGMFTAAYVPTGWVIRSVD